MKKTLLALALLVGCAVPAVHAAPAMHLAGYRMKLW